MAGTFDRRIAHLSREVGVGNIVAHCEVNQPYAQNQHETESFDHHGVGRSHYLGGPLLENIFTTMQEIAGRVITENGSDLEKGMIDVSEKMARYVLTNAPKDTHRLSLSGHPSVTDNGSVVYDRPPIAAREERP
jgi:hypothetical protein